MPQESLLYRPRRPGSQRLPVSVLAALLVAAALAPPPCGAAEARARRHGKIGGALTRLYESHVVGRLTGLPEEERPPVGLMARDDTYVTIDAVAIDGDGEGLLAELEALGLRAGSHFRHMASGRFPIARLEELEGLSKLRFAKPYYPLAYAVQSQGDAAMLADDVRSTDGVTGAGVTVGAMSTSFDCIDPNNNQAGSMEIGYLEDVASGDLPAGLSPPLQDLDETLGFPVGGCEPEGLATDEGRAMLQIVHDVAPDAALLFHSAANGQADFAQGVLDLRDAGADVIVDDLGVADEPYYQDGLVSQAIDQVVSDGVTYLAAAGNWSNLGLETSAAGRWSTDPVFGRTAFDFDPGAGTDHYLRITVPPVASIDDAGGLVFVLHWDQPYASATGGAGATTDLRLWLLNNGASNQPTTLANFCAANQPAGSPDGDEDNVGFDPVEALQFVNLSGLPFTCGGGLSGTPVNASTFNLFIEHESGPLPTRIALLVLAPTLGSASGFTVVDAAFFPGGPTVFGHANAASALTIGSANYDQTPEFGQTPPLLAPYSSIGPGAPVYYDGADNRRPVPVVRAKPELTCPDGADISFNPCGTFTRITTNYLCLIAEDTDDAGTFPNFFGTSAAAAHCAGGAALLLEKEPAQFPVDVYKALVTGAVNMGPAGFDTSTGWGLVQLDAASASLDCAELDGFNLILTSGSEAGNPVTRHACNAVHASGYTIEDTADVTFLAGERVVLGDGFTVESGAVFVAALD